MNRDEALRVLGIRKRHPTDAEIKTAYKRAAMRHHPDRGGDAELFKKLNPARDFLLSHPAEDIPEPPKTGPGPKVWEDHDGPQRQHGKTVDDYLRQNKAQNKPGAGKMDFGHGRVMDEDAFDFSIDRFERMTRADKNSFGYERDGIAEKELKAKLNTGHKHNRTSPSVYRIKVNLPDTVHGGVHRTSFNYLQHCPLCNGYGKETASTSTSLYGMQGRFRPECPLCKGSGIRVSTTTVNILIPENVVNGDSREITFRTTHGVKDEITVIYECTIPPNVRVVNGVLHDRVPIPFDTAILGGKVRYTTPLGITLDLNISPRTKAGTSIRVQGHGFGGKDLMCEVVITTPTEFTDQQLAAIAQYRKVSTGR